MIDHLQQWRTAIRRHADASGIELPGDVVDELAGHVADAVTTARARGASADEARAIALETVVAATMADLRATRRARAERQTRLLARPSATGIFEGVLFDVRFAVRVLWRSPLFTVSVIGILAISIGAVLAVSAAVQAVLLKPLSFATPEDLVVLTRVDKDGRRGSMSAADWADYNGRVRAFAQSAAYSNWTHNLTGGGEPLRLRSVIATGAFFHVLGVPPRLGRTFTANDDQAAAALVVVLSHGFWIRRFGGDLQVVGQRVTLNGRAAEIVGVMPPSFDFPSRDVDLWMPIAMGAELKSDRASEWLQTVVRLRRDTPVVSAQAEAEALAAALAREYPTTNAGERARLTPLLDHIVGDARTSLLIIGAAVIVVFLVACLNVANLLLARASVRRDEMAVGLAIGATRWRLTRQIVAESALVTLIGSVGGGVIGWGCLRALLALSATRIPRLEGATLSGLVVTTAATASAAVVICCAVAATLALARRGGAIGAAGTRVARGSGLRPALLTAQTALSFVLVMAATLVAGSYVQLQRVPAGFSSDDVLSARVTLPRQKYPDDAAHVRFVDAVVEQLGSSSGLTSVGVINDLPFGGNQMSFAVTVDPPMNDASPRATVRLTTPGYFEVLRIPIVEGRGLSSDDRAGREAVALVNTSAAREFWRGRALDQRLRIGQADEWRRVIGVVPDVRHAGFQREEGPVVYVPYAQKSFAFVNWIGILARGRSVETLVSNVKRAVAAVDNTQPVYDVLLLDDAVARPHAPFRFNSWIMTALAALSLTLAIAGVFALASYDAAMRRHEFGVRLALGASSLSVLRLVIGRALRFVLAGTAIGAAAAFLVGRSLNSVLFEMSASDARVFAGVAVVLCGAAVTAALPAAWHASHLDPTTTIRAE